MRCLLYLFCVLSFCVHSQDLNFFIKSDTAKLSITDVIPYPDGTTLCAVEIRSATSLKAGLVKLSPIGEINWAKQFNFSQSVIHHSLQLEVLPSGIITACGQFNALDPSGTDYVDYTFFARFNSLGQFLSGKVLDANETILAAPLRLKVSTQGNSIVRSPDYHYSNFHYIDQGGNVLWSKRYDGANSSLMINDYTPTSDQGVLLLSDSPVDFSLTKLSANNGDLVWSKKYKRKFLNPTHLLVHSSGDIFLSGIISDTLGITPTTLLMRMNSQGEILWIKHLFWNFGGIESILEKNGMLVISAEPRSNSGYKHHHIFSFTPTGELINAAKSKEMYHLNNVPIPGTTGYRKLQVSNDYFYSFGRSSEAFGEPKEAIFNRTPAPENDPCYWLPYTDSVVTVPPIPSENNPLISVELPESTQLSFTTTPIALYTEESCRYLSLPEQSEAPIAMYPNPSEGIVHFSGMPPHAKLHILDQLGKIVWSSESTASNHSIDLSELPNGVYNCSVSTQKERFILRLILAK